jgi:hypothetical protein
MVGWGDSDFRFQISDFRFQISDFRLKRLNISQNQICFIAASLRKIPDFEEVIFGFQPNLYWIV